MREYSKKINLIQIVNKKIQKFNEIVDDTEHNTIYYIENVDINAKEVNRILMDLDGLAKQINEDNVLEQYLEIRYKLDKLKDHIEKTNQLKQKNSTTKSEI